MTCKQLPVSPLHPNWSRRLLRLRPHFHGADQHDRCGDGAPCLAADNAVHGCLVVAPPVAAWRDLGLPDHAVSLSINGETVSDGRGANALGGPLTALTWLANALRADPAGPGLRAGELVTTGVVTGFRLVSAGDAVGADFGALGRVELRFTA